MTLRVVEPGFLATVQDLGRAYWRSSGVPLGGGMDWFALAATNRLVGNSSNAACIEFYGSGPALNSDRDCVVSVTGRGFVLEVDERCVPAWASCRVKAGQTLRLVNEGAACWGYLAISAGIAVPEVLGSRSTFLRGGFGGWNGRLLQMDDELPVGELDGQSKLFNSTYRLPEKCRPLYDDIVLLRVVKGPQDDRFDKKAWKAFTESEYCISDASDRMGYRLQGTPIKAITNSDVLSEPAWPGAVQVPVSGQPMVLMCDAQTTGGYAKIASVISADLPLLAQCPVGRGRVRFSVTTVTQAQKAYREMVGGLNAVEVESSH